MPRRVPLALALMLSVLAPRAGEAQRLVQPLAVATARPSSPNSLPIAIQSPGELPRWVKWGLVGAVAGGAFFAVAGQSNVDGGHSATSDALIGAGAGFVIIGGGVALYDSMCARDTRSRRSGLCGH